MFVPVFVFLYEDSKLSDGVSNIWQAFLSLNLHLYLKKLSYQRARVICDWSSLESNLFLLGAKTSCRANTNYSSGELYVAPIHISGLSFQSVGRYMIQYFCNSVKLNSIHATKSKEDKISPKDFWQKSLMNKTTSKFWYMQDSWLRLPEFFFFIFSST